MQEFAPAKVNLALHVTGRRDDGYHLLDSLVAFASTADRLTFSRSEAFSLHLTGPFGTALDCGPENLVMKAATRWAERAGTAVHPATITLEKNLPVASGIGGGSADAAATLRGLTRLWQLDADRELLCATALELGADVPVCLDGSTCKMSGIGEQLKPVSNMPNFAAVLINPMVPVTTADVFRRLGLSRGASGFAELEYVPVGTEQTEWLGWLKRQRNDLEAVATELAPAVAEALSVLRDQKDCLLARMSGSGATCFGLFPNEQTSKEAAERIRASHPNCWVAATHVG